MKHIIWGLLDSFALYKARRNGIDNKKIVAVCRMGLGYLDNPKHIIEALERLYPNTYTYVLLVKKVLPGLPAYIHQIELGTRAALIELATARFWMSDARFTWPIDKLPTQIYLQTWHACMGPKLAEGSAKDKLSDAYLAIAKRDGKMTDFMFANDSIHEREFRNHYWQNGPVIRCGAPRNHPLIFPDISSTYALRRKMKIPIGNGLLLYAPTFRNTGFEHLSAKTLQRCAALLEEVFNRPFSIAFRLHTEDRNTYKDLYPNSFIDTSTILDTQEVLCATDILISDYSSIMEDFLLLGRPCFTYAPDLENYLQERGLLYPLENRPTPLAKNVDELLSAIKSFNFEVFLKKREEFFCFLDATEDGRGDEVLATLIHELMSSEVKVNEVIEFCRARGMFDAVLQKRGEAPAALPIAAEWDAMLQKGNLSSPLL